MDRIYMNRIDGQRRIHVEIHENEVSDLLDDLKADPEHFASTRLFLGILRVAEEIFLPAVSETRRNREDAARTASGQQPEHTCPDGEPCPGHDQPDPTTADDPTPLRWGLGDVLHGDDDTVTVCLSGPNLEPYWLELDPERAAVLRKDLAPDDAPAVGQPAEAQATDEARRPQTRWHIEGYDADEWNSCTGYHRNREDALKGRESLQRRYPDMPTRLVRETTTWTVEDETR